MAEAPLPPIGRPRKPREYPPGELPLLMARKRERKRLIREGKFKQGGSQSVLSETEKGIAVGLAAAGLTQPKIGVALGVTTPVIRETIFNMEGAAEIIQDIRTKLKLLKIHRAHALEGKLWDLAEKRIEAEDAKGVDGTLRALHASEKIQQAVSGEAQKVDVTTQQPMVDLHLLIQQILKAP